MPMKSDLWNDERLADATRWWKAGDDATTIATRLACGLTRSAILGKMFRLGIKQGKNPAEVQKQSSVRAQTKRVAAAPPAPKPPPPPKPVRASPDAGRTDLVLLIDLGHRHCRWPIGVPDKADFGFCGRDKDGERSYCPEHCVVAYQPLPPRAAAKRNRAPELARMARNFA